MKKLSYIVLLLLFSCGKPLQDNKSSLISSNIIGGEFVAKNDLTELSTVTTLNVHRKIFRKTEITQFCTGTLISPDLIVSAAHCEETEFNKGPEFVWFGAKIPRDDKFNKDNMIAIKARAIAPRYASGVMDEYEMPIDDLIIYRLSKKAPKEFKPVAILDADDQILLGTPIIQAGFGNTTFIANENGSDLKKVTQFFNRYVDEKMFINRVGDYGGNSGDSGGPVYVKDGNELIVFGAHQASSIETKESLFINLSAYKQVILDAAKKLNAIPPVFKKRMNQ